MKDSITELEKTLVQDFKLINSLKNEVEIKELQKQDQLKEIALGIIAVLDSFERIEANFSEKGLDKSEETGKAIVRYATLQKKLINLLNKYDIKKMEFPDNLIVPGCEVVETEADSNRKNDEIVSIITNGYKEGEEEVIRPAQIIIIKN